MKLSLFYQVKNTTSQSNISPSGVTQFYTCGSHKNNIRVKYVCSN